MPLGTGDRDADPMDQWQLQTDGGGDGDGDETVRCARVGGPQDDHQEKKVSTVSATHAEPMEYRPDECPSKMLAAKPSAVVNPAWLLATTEPIALRGISGLGQQTSILAHR